MTAVVPGRGPSTDPELARSFHDRLARLESARTVRVGPWVLSSDTATGNLIATRPGQTVLLDGDGATEITGQQLNLSGLKNFVTNEQLQAALSGIDTDGGGITGLIDSAFAQLYEMLTGSGIDPLGALTKLADFLKIELGGPVDIARLPLLPLAHIRDIITELLPDPDFDNPNSLERFLDWDWLDIDGVDSPGVAQTIADGLTHIIYSDPIPAAPGDTLDVMAKAKWIDLTTSGPEPIRMFVSFYNAANQMIGSPVEAGRLGAPGTSGGVGGWQTMTGSVEVPAGTKYAIQELAVTPAATGGTVRFGQASVSKSGLLPQGYVAGLLDAISGLWNGIQARLNDFMDLLDVFGGFAVGSGQGQLTDVVTRLSALNPITGLLDAARLTNMGDLPFIPNALDKVPELGGLVNKATGALSGAVQAGEQIIGAGLEDAEQVMANLFEMLTSTTRKVQALEADATSNSVGGRRFNINFSEYPDGPFPAGLFHITYSGPGTSVLAINEGNAVWNMVNNGYRRAVLRYPTPTLTPFQIVRGTMATPPQQASNVRIWSLGRMNAAGTDYVFARGYCTGFLQYRGDIGCVKGGVEYVWASNVSLTWSLDLRVVMGVGTNVRRHMVLSGDTVVWDGVEPPDKQSIVDADHLYWGSLSETNGSKHPGEIAGASVVDNAPPAVVGTTFRASRRVGSDTTIGSGGVPVPNNFYETIDYISPDLIYRPGSNCEIEVSKQGTYLVAWRALHGQYASGTYGHGLLFKNGARYERWGWGGNQLNLGFSVNTTLEDATVGFAMVPMNPGDRLQPGFHFTASMGNTGDNVALADGSQSWFAVTRVGI
ncbi:minor tail protein [Mycobacterium phage Saguaro]|uniref:Minor tail protein n=1 Tax=Mycobacterium phage Saguaro TaxID=2315616 RepID=A0A386KCP0_9CAUD|nr:minor tail protein [Mycobacterium phage Saguaro]AYD82026.1 minor tail protein [Mycobacterium phage Saguaro]